MSTHIEHCVPYGGGASPINTGHLDLSTLILNSIFQKPSNLSNRYSPTFRSVPVVPERAPARRSLRTSRSYRSWKMVGYAKHPLLEKEILARVAHTWSESEMGSLVQLSIHVLPDFYDFGRGSHTPQVGRLIWSGTEEVPAF